MGARRFDRACVRSLAEQHSAELLEVSGSGGNHHQRALDQADALNALVADLSQDDQAAFFQMYAEEMTACASHARDKSHNESLQKIEDAHSAGLDAWWIVVILIMVATFLVLAVTN